jgi:hypothetical protein
LILTGEGNLAHASKSSHVYWRHLSFLYKLSVKEDSTLIEELLVFSNTGLGLDEMEEANEEQAALLHEVWG